MVVMAMAPHRTRWATDAFQTMVLCGGKAPGRIGVSSEYIAYVRSSEMKDAIEEIRLALSSGLVLAHGETRAPSNGGSDHRQIDPVEWTTLPFSTTLMGRSAGPYVKVRIARAAIEKLARRLAKSSTATASAQASRSPFRIEIAREIFDRHAGWLGLSQKSAARELRVQYESQFRGDQIPAEQTCVGWIREWREADRIRRSRPS